MSRLFAIRSQRTVTPAGAADRAVLVRDGRIESVSAPGEIPAGVPVEDLGDTVLLPGLVDSHVHVNEPGRTEWEGFDTATRAAAAGGITTIVDMPLNCIPVTTSPAALAVKVDAAAPHLWVDCAFWGGVVPDNARSLPSLLRAGVAGCKAFLCPSGIDDFPKATAADLRAAMPALAAAGLPLLAHAELERDDVDEAVLATLPPSSYRRWLLARPRAWEDAAIALLVALCRETGCAVHVVHLSSATALPILRAARAEGLPITVETCPHYLGLVAEEVPDGATAFKCAPPIREAKNREALWEGLADGTIDLVVTDHSPCTPGLKHPEDGDFVRAWGGIASLQVGLSAVWTEASRRGFPIARLAEWMSAAPARLAGLAGRKGAIAPGMDADLVAWDPDATATVDPAALHHRHKVSPWCGRTLRGVVRATWIRGAKVAENGRILGQPTGTPLLGRPA